MVPDQPPCHRGLLPERCAYEHVAAELDRGVGGGKSLRVCPCHDDRNASLSINPGTQGMRIVWNCHTGCAPADIRVELLDRGVDESCLGRYGLPKRGAGAYGHPAYSPGIVADAKRWQALRKLPAEVDGKLLVMCIQAISDGDGDLPPDPLELLPVNMDDFLALAKRAGIERRYRYQLFRRWLQSDIA